ncbi:MAG: NAD(P)/FAD-dependent oxidoreductase [Betaproteobacteria bacterium]|nr:NAD(P)/FAD-dependent oxidoreductase [Betaproteobacteria bacterium]NBS46950.1 NAD(P)/FAD-dependent oxidoreductase [Betaproteobacteria bacterium]
MDRVDAVVIGAGVVGLACARALAMAGREVLVLESADAIGTGTSSRNSEVIHAGIYYPAGSLKARLCVQGRQMLYAYCDSHGVAYRRCGKLIVATSEGQREALRGVLSRGHANGVRELVLIDAAQAQSMEPALHCIEAVHSPNTGIIDSHGLMLALQGDLERHGGALALQSPFDGARHEAGDWIVRSGDTGLACKLLVNAGGLHAPRLALGIEGVPPERVPVARYAKGHYFTLAGRAPFSRLIYPIPEAAGLGVHLTLDLGGQAKFGPDVQWVDDDSDYSVDASRADGFYAEVRKYWPALADGALQPGYAGIRPKISGPGEAAADFMIDGPAGHGVPGLVNLFGIESPGLTSCLAIADQVLALLDVPRASA